MKSKLSPKVNPKVNPEANVIRPLFWNNVFQNAEKKIGITSALKSKSKLKLHSFRNKIQPLVRKFCSQNKV